MPNDNTVFKEYIKKKADEFFNVVDISYVEQFNAQRVKDAAAMSMEISKGNLHVDEDDLDMVSQAVFRATGERANRDMLKTLLTRKSIGNVLAALKIATAEHKAYPMSITGICYRIAQVMDTKVK